MLSKPKGKVEFLFVRASRIKIFSAFFPSRIHLTKVAYGLKRLTKSFHISSLSHVAMAPIFMLGALNFISWGRSVILLGVPLNLRQENI